MASLTDDEAREKADRESASRSRASSPSGAAAALPDAGSRALAAFRGFLARGRFSSLTRRIVAFNVAALFVLLSGILYLNQFREGLIDARRQSLLTQAEIIAGAIEEGATTSLDGPLIDPLAAGAILAPPPGTDPDEGFDAATPINPATAAPILDRNRRLLGSLSITTVTAELVHAGESRHLQALLRTARAIGQAMR